MYDVWQEGEVSGYAETGDLGIQCKYVITDMVYSFAAADDNNASISISIDLNGMIHDILASVAQQR
jgi:hypothetical protein